MPPKAPNLKFKPKLVLREEDTTVHSPPPQPTDDLSLVQLARMQGLYVNEERSVLTSDATTTGGGSESAPQPGPHGASSSRTAATTSSSGGGGGGGGGTSSGASGGTTRRAPATQQSRAEAEGGDEEGTQGSSALLRPKAGRAHHLSAHAALEEASRRHMDLSDYPEAAPPLPVNSMNTIVSPAMTRQSALLQTPLYPPLPLDAALPSRMAAEAQTATGASAAVATAVTAAGEAKDVADGALGVDGTAFLREAERERQHAYAANTRFFEEHLRPTQRLDGARAETVAGGELLWMQLPRFHDNPPFSFADLPPGKIGELKVLRSGRMVMEIAGVYYDVAVEGYDEVGNDGACAMAVATQPSPNPADPASKASCYELGLLQKKLICTPTLP